MPCVELLPADHVTVIDNRFQISDIANFKQLPARIQAEIKSVDALRSHGFQELNGYKDRTIILSCGGHWTHVSTGTHIERYGLDEQFEVTSYGSHNYQWDGTTLRNTIKEYV